MKNERNREKFAALKKLNLPIDQYAIIGSGPLGIRNLREINDIDLIVTNKLWNSLVAKYVTVDKKGTKKIAFPNMDIEAFGEESFYSEEKEKGTPTIAERIATADRIEGLPFERLEHLLYYKRKWGREKDLKDILLIEQALKEKRP